MLLVKKIFLLLVRTAFRNCQQRLDSSILFRRAGNTLKGQYTIYRTRFQLSIYLLINITLSWKTSYLKESLLSDKTFISIFILSVLLQRSISFIEKIMMKFAQSCPTLCDPMDYTYSPWNSLGQNTGVGSLSLL